MKSKLQISTVIFLLSLGTALADGVVVNPTTGLTVRNRAGTPQPQTMPAATDPTTGLPLPAPVVEQPDWKDPEWKDPDIVLTNVNFDGLPLGEIANFIRDQFKGQFDIILPDGTSGDAINRLTGAPLLTQSAAESINWRDSTQLNLRLKDVTASELFNAMNLIFENDKTPLQWELKINGHRQLALLRVLVDPPPQAQPQPLAREPERRIYFVGDLIGDEKTGGMTMEQIIKTVTDVWNKTNMENGKIQFHEEAQLLIVTGTPSQIEFVEQTLNALHQKVELARRSLQTKTKADESRK